MRIRAARVLVRSVLSASAMTIFDVLQRRQQELEVLFREIDAAVAADKHRLARARFRELSVKLIACLRAEHAVVYPRFAYLAHLHAEIADASREHDAIERAINHIRLSLLEPAAWHAAVTVLKDLVAAHAVTEEWVVFPMAHVILTSEALCEIGEAFMAYEPIAASVAGPSITYDVAA